MAYRTHITRRALLSVWKKGPEFRALVGSLNRQKYELVASGGTYKFIKNELDLPVINTSEITNLEPVLDHRVATLCPQLHGGLLADENLHAEELAKLGWPNFDIVVSTFYPLAKTMEEKSGDHVAINNSVDIGGPCLIRSAMKGGRIVVCDENDFEFVTNQMIHGHAGLRLKDKDWLRAKAAAWIAQYTATETVFRINQIRPATVK